MTNHGGRAYARSLCLWRKQERWHRWEPARWQAAMTKREDVRETGEVDVQRPQKIIDGDRFVLKDKTREVQFLFLGFEDG
jgi:cyclase